MTTNKKGEPKLWERTPMRRIAKGIIAIALGMNIVAFGMKLNCSNHAGNPAWEIVSSYLTLQLWIIVLAIFIAIAFVITKYGFVEKADEQSFEELPPKQSPYRVETSKAEAKNIQPLKEIPKDIVTKTTEQPQKLGKEDLKKRVLRELTGRSDI